MMNSNLHCMIVGPFQLLSVVLFSYLISILKAKPTYPLNHSLTHYHEISGTTEKIAMELGS